MTATTAIEVALETPVSARADASERFYRPELDALRAGAFLLVFVHHALPQQAAGWQALGLSPAAATFAGWAIGAGGYGVDLFFALSS